MRRYRLYVLLTLSAVGFLVLFALGWIDLLTLLGVVGMVLGLAVCWSSLRIRDRYVGGRVARSPRPPTYEELRDLFLFLESPPENDHFPYTDWIQLLVDAKLLTWRSANHMGVTDLGREVARRLRAGGDAPEIRCVVDPTA